MKVKVTQSCPTLCKPTDYTVHGILQARIQEWVAFSFSRGSSQPRDQTQVYCIAGRFFTSWANLILSIYEYKYLSCYVTRKKMKVADGIRFANQLTLRLSWIIWRTGSKSAVCLVMSASLRPHGLYSPWNSPGQNTWVGSLSLLHGIFPRNWIQVSCIGEGFFTS